MVIYYLPAFGFLGVRRMRNEAGGKDQHYLGGGSGYTMSKKAFKAYVEGPLQTCDIMAEGSAEDIYSSNCFRKYLTGHWIDTRDDVGAHRYHQLSVDHHAAYPIVKFGSSTAMISQSLQYMEREYGFPIVYQSDYISNSSVTFHKNSDPDELRPSEMILYGEGIDGCNTIGITTFKI